MRSLTVKLVLAFLIVSLTGAALSAAFTRWATNKEFDRLVFDKAEADLITELTAYYRTHGSWNDVANNIMQRRRPATQETPRSEGKAQSDGAAQLQPGAPFLGFILIDQKRTVVIPSGDYRISDTVPPGAFDRETAIEIDGQVVGTVLSTGKPLLRDPREERYIVRTDQALLLSGLISTLGALVLGVVLARTLAHPLRELTAATHAMAKGQLGRQVPIRSRDELGELAVSFNRMSTDLAKANELRRQMTADIAHELRTPLTVMAGYIEALRDGVLKPTPARFDAMNLEAQQLKRLVEDLRTLSLADAGELPLTRQATDPYALLERVATAFSHRAGQENIALRISADDSLPEIRVDPERLVQVLENLVSNALRHTEGGGEIKLSARATDEAVWLAVQDSGRGIAPDVLPHVFDRFYRGDDARSDEGGESGLGLAIAKSIVEAHGGGISASSPGIDQGATFTIRLPLQAKTYGSEPLAS